MPQPAVKSSKGPPLAWAGRFLAGASSSFFPDAFVFALAAGSLVIVGELRLGEKPSRLISEFGGSFWALVPFTMQMALVIIGGFVVASSPLLARAIGALGAVPKTARGAVAFV